MSNPNPPTGVNRELAKIDNAKNADKIRDQVRARAEAEAKKLLHNQRNVTSYTPMGVLPQTLQQQLQARAQSRHEATKPKTPEQKAASLDVQNAIANMRAAKGIESPGAFAGETEYLPSAESVLAGITQTEDEGTPVPTAPEAQPTFNIKDYAEQLVRNGQARSMGHALDKAKAAAKKAGK